MASGVLQDAFDFCDDVINQTNIKLAVTGLSRSGKTVFMTSMIQNLLVLDNNLEGALPEISKRLCDQTGRTRLKKITIIPAGAQQINQFDFKSKVSLLEAEKPDWPRPTDDISTISLMLELGWGGSGFLRPLKNSLPNRSIKIDIIDYPGEWLLDLPLLYQSYEEWSSSTLKLMDSEPRSKCFEEFRDYIRNSHLSSNKKSQDSEVLIKEAHQLYKKGLLECRFKYGLQYLQPGRFVCPGPKGGDLPLFWFFPLEPSGSSAKQGSIQDLLKKRFDAYKKYVCEEFFDKYFDQFNRQIFLVDVLTALHQGRTIFTDTQKAIEEILSGMARRQEFCITEPIKAAKKLLNGKFTISGKNFSGQIIKKLVVAATKADHVPEISQHNMAFLVEDMTRAKVKGIFKDNFSFHAIASIASTEPSTLNFKDKEVAAVVGKVDGQIRQYYVGQIPSKIPEKNYFDHKFFSLPNFEPRPFDSKVKYIKNINLDKVLIDIVGDLI